MENKVYGQINFSSRISSNLSTVKLDIRMNTYKNDKNINKERDNIDANVQKLQVFGQRSPSCTLTLETDIDRNEELNIEVNH